MAGQRSWALASWAMIGPVTIRIGNRFLILLALRGGPNFGVVPNIHAVDEE